MKYTALVDLEGFDIIICVLIRSAHQLLGIHNHAIIQVQLFCHAALVSASIYKLRTGLMKEIIVNQDCTFLSLILWIEINCLIVIIGYYVVCNIDIGLRYLFFIFFLFQLGLLYYLLIKCLGLLCEYLIIASISMCCLNQQLWFLLHISDCQFVFNDGRIYILHIDRSNFSG